MFKGYPYYFNPAEFVDFPELFNKVDILGGIVVGHTLYINNEYPDFFIATVYNSDGDTFELAHAGLLELDRLRIDVEALANTYSWEYIDNTACIIYPFTLQQQVTAADMLIKNLLINRVVPAYDRDLHLQAETLQRQAIAIRCLSIYIRHSEEATHKKLAKELNVTKARIQQLVKNGKQLYIKGQSDVSKKHTETGFNESEFKD